jgi:hypothetical protein
MAHNRPDIPNQYEQVVLQVLRDAGWVDGSKKFMQRPGLLKS